jgi:hypothetical protein
MMTERNLLTAEQLKIQQELCETYDELTPENISFDKDDPTPMFDYEAISLLSVKLTDIQDIDCQVIQRDDTRVTVKCRVTLPDGRTRGVEHSGQLGEILPGGKTVDTMSLAEAVARSRAARLGIRSVGVNLFKAHKKFKETGEIAAGHLRFDPRKPIYDEIHAAATDLALIVNGDKSAYRQFIAESFGGAESAKDLSGEDLRKLQVMFRALVNANRFAQKKAA